MREFDLVVVGGGPGGYVAAIRASQLGMRVAVVEREHLGGICLNWGCIPTKALLRTAEIQHILSDLDAYGFSARDIRFDLEKVVARSRRVSDRLARGIRQLLKKNSVEHIEGSARLSAPGRVAVEGLDSGVTEELQASHVILATGARPKGLPGIESDGERIWTYREAMVPDALPGSLLVIGSGAIGIEFASFYRDLGVEVTVVETLARILPAEDEEISALALKSFRRRGIEFHLGATLTRLERRGEGLVAGLELADGEILEADYERAILAVGIQGNVEGIGLEGTGVVVSGGHIEVDQWLETGEPGVYAIGDVAGPPWLAHKASHEGTLCVEHLAGVEGLRPLAREAIPACTYSRPQIASLGLTEAAAAERGIETRVGRFPFLANGKALAQGESEGLVKTIFAAETGELLGAHLFGAEVTELIHGYAIARSLETTEVQLMETVFPHPTLSEAMHESVLDAYGRAIHF
ncbi:dihydrolipoyl dehydrogenase [Myxococcota bacterium]|nr:dihydrolipoyl dehydrogenase [Myxococcota bacterium]